jgi:hypothetical protein
MLGTILGAMALAGRDKLTLITPPPLDTLGLWIEQLIAESTGKEGKGIVPIAGEPPLDPRDYGNDRIFVPVEQIARISRFSARIVETTRRIPSALAIEISLAYSAVPSPWCW